MMRFKNIFLVLPLFFALNVNAQATGMLEEVVVTAQKKEENLQDTPIAITALTESTIDDLDLANIVDLANLAPNVHIINTPSNNTAATIAIRGGSTTNPAITWEPTVGMYLDGVYLGKGQGSIFDVVDLERVEILRGPQGTLYGRNTLGGAINLITAPKEKRQINALEFLKSSIILSDVGSEYHIILLFSFDSLTGAKISQLGKSSFNFIPILIPFLVIARTETFSIIKTFQL